MNPNIKTRNGKIARLPLDIREGLNKRIREGELAPQLIAWLNSLPEVLSVCQEFFSGALINAQNISDWRHGGYQDWDEKQGKTHRVKELAAWAMKLSTANGGRIAEGASAIASGKLLELLEAVDGAMDLEQLGDVVSSLANLRGSEIAQQRADTDREKVKQKDKELALAREKFQRETCELFIKWSQDQRAVQLAAAPLSNESKLEEMGKLMFGDLWTKAKTTP